MLNIPETIKKYSDKGFFIESVGICWRGYVYWKSGSEWNVDDCGCFSEWMDAFKSVIQFIEGLEKY